MSNRIDQLEYTVMELGSQVFRLKQELNSLNQHQGAVVGFIKNVRAILEEKGIFDLEEFDGMSDLNKLLDQFEDGEADDSQMILKSCLH